MADAAEAIDRIIVRLDPGGPVELTGLTESFGALARMYERHYRHENIQPAPKLYVTRLRTGSIEAEIAPYIVLLGTALASMDGALVISDFTRRLWAGIKAFSDPDFILTGGPVSEPHLEVPSLEDAEDIKAFVRPLIGKRGASLGIKHAKFEKRDGERTTVVEYKFDEAELNRAAINIDEALVSQVLPFSDDDAETIDDKSILTEVMLFFDQASRKPGKEKGRTGDRGIIPDVTTKPLPVYWSRRWVGWN